MPNVYAWDRATEEVRLAGVLPDGTTPPEGSRAGRGAEAQDYLQDGHLVGEDGSVLFNDRESGQLYLRLNPTAKETTTYEGGSCVPDPVLACTVHVSASQKTNGGGPEEPGGIHRDAAGPRPAKFLAASPDAKTIVFSSSEKLTDDANTGIEPAAPAIARAKAADGGEKELDWLLPFAKEIAVDEAGDHVYWSDPDHGRIGRAKLDGSEVEESWLPEVGKPRGIAVIDDGTHEYAFWTDRGELDEEGKPQEGKGSIGRVKLDGSEVKPDCYAGLTNPRSIAASSDNLYWTIPGRTKTEISLAEGNVGRADLECNAGSVEEHLIENVASGDIAVDASHIYFSFHKSEVDASFIRRYNLDGTAPETVVEVVGAKAVPGLALDGSHLYWTNPTTHCIGRSGLDGSSSEQCFIGETGRGEDLAGAGEYLLWTVNQEVVANPGNDLYSLDRESGALTDLAPDATETNGTEVQGVLGTSKDASYVYFAANGVPDGVTNSPNEAGESAQAGDCKGTGNGAMGTCNLYVAHGGGVEFVARLKASAPSGEKDSGDALNWVAGHLDVSTEGEKTARVSADGQALVFRSTRKLTAYDVQGPRCVKGIEAGSRAAGPCPEFYRFDYADKSVSCLTCDPRGTTPGEPPRMTSVRPFGIKALLPEATLARNLSADGERFFFETGDSLVAADANGSGCLAQGSNACQDVYEWEAPGKGSCKKGSSAYSEQNQGCIYLISSGKSEEASFFGDADPEGENAFIFTYQQLVGQDEDALFDAYDARVGGGLAGQSGEKPRHAAAPNAWASHHRRRRATLGSPDSAGLSRPPQPRPPPRPQEAQAQEARPPRAQEKAQAQAQEEAPPACKEPASGQADREDGPMRAKGKIAIGLAALAAAALGPAGSAAAAPGPAWKLDLISLPTNLRPGTMGSVLQAPVYELIATNVGSGDAEGPVRLSVTLPDGVKPIFDSSSPVGQDGDSSTPNPACDKTESQTVTCIAAVGPIHPSRNLGIKIPVKVEAGLEPGKVLPDATASVESPGLAAVSASAPTTIDTAPPPFGFLAGANGLAALFTTENGSPATAAGSHPDQLTVDIGFPVDQPGGSGLTTNAGHPRDLIADLPQGVVVNPRATKVRCTEVQLLGGSCPDGSQIGMVTVVTEVIGPQPADSALYNMVPTPGSAATVAFNAASAGIYVHLGGGVRSEGDYGLYAASRDTLAVGANPIEHIQAQVWGAPSASSHDQIRRECRIKAENTCPVEPTEAAESPLITMPSACSDTLEVAARARSWEESEEGVGGLPHRTSALATDTEGNPTGVSECPLLEFNPTLTVQPETEDAETPTGVHIDLEVPQHDGAALATSTLKDTRVSFPPGLVANAAAAGGQDACSPTQIGMLTGAGESPVHLSADPPQCPAASKLGTLEVSTPLLDHTLPGTVYLAEPYQNPFGTLLAAYLVIESPQDGIEAKVGEQDRSRPEQRPAHRLDRGSAGAALQRGQGRPLRRAARRPAHALHVRYLHHDLAQHSLVGHAAGPLQRLLPDRPGAGRRRLRGERSGDGELARFRSRHRHAPGRVLLALRRQAAPPRRHPAGSRRQPQPPARPDRQAGGDRDLPRRGDRRRRAQAGPLRAGQPLLPGRLATGRDDRRRRRRPQPLLHRRQDLPGRALSGRAALGRGDRPRRGGAL